MSQISHAHSSRRQRHQPTLPLEIFENGPGGLVGISRTTPQDLIAQSNLEGNQVRMEGPSKISVGLEQTQQQGFGVGMADGNGTEGRAAKALRSTGLEQPIPDRSQAPRIGAQPETTHRHRLGQGFF